MTPPPDVEFTAALAVADRALRGVLGDPGAWGDEAANGAAEPLPWPLQGHGEGYPQLLRLLAAEAVESTLQAIHETEGEVVDADPSSARFQLVLRVVNRAVLAADTAIRSALLPGRLTGKRDFLNWVKWCEVQTAVEAGGPRAETLRKLPMSRASAYRAMKRKR